MIFLKASIIVSLKQAIESACFIEKFIWICMGTLGSIYFRYLLVSQVNSWDENSILVSHERKSINEIDFPAITFCTQKSTKYAVAERIGNSLSFESIFRREELLSLRNDLIRFEVDFDFEETQAWMKAEERYKSKCGHGSNEKDEDWKIWCEVRLILPGICYNLLVPFLKALTLRFFSFQRPLLLYGYAKRNNLSFYDIYQDLQKEMLHTWNVSRAVSKFLKHKEAEITSNTTIDFEDKDEWVDFHAVREIIGDTEKYNWFPNMIGSFLTDRLLAIMNDFYKSDRTEKIISLAENVDKIFTIPEMGVSLLNFAHLHTTNDFSQLLIAEEMEGIAKVKNIRNFLTNFPVSFYNCLKQESTYFKKMNMEGQLDDTIAKLKYMEKSPCVKKRHLKICREYCQWSNSSHFSKKEFLRLMKLSLPQGKIPMEQDELELDIVRKLVPRQSLKNKPMISPVPLVAFCKYRKNLPWKGQDIGMSSKVCDDFKQTPSDIGICVTGGMDMPKIFKNDDFGHGQSLQKIKGGTYSGVSSFIIDTDGGKTSQTFERNKNGKPDEVQIQIHPTNEMAQIMYDENQDHDRRSLLLKRGYEYTLKINVNGRVLSTAFQNLPSKLRKCKLQTEGEDDSWFKTYSKQGCKYQCRSKLAYEKCGCFPWDFYHIGNYSECDVFGRTCFVNALENATHFIGDPCDDHCNEDCEYLQYRYTITNTEKITMNWETKYDYDKQGLVDICYGTKTLCEYIENKNNTQNFNDKDTKWMIDHKKERSSGLIIVNLIYPTSTADLVVLDARYTLIDKISSLGGSFGLFTQFTGCSIIAIIHLTILTFKQVYALIKDLKAKMFPQG